MLTSQVDSCARRASAALASTPAESWVPLGTHMTGASTLLPAGTGTALPVGLASPPARARSPLGIAATGTTVTLLASVVLWDCGAVRVVVCILGVLGLARLAEATKHEAAHDDAGEHECAERSCSFSGRLVLREDEPSRRSRRSRRGRRLATCRGGKRTLACSATLDHASLAASTLLLMPLSADCLSPSLPVLAWRSARISARMPFWRDESSEFECSLMSEACEMAELADTLMALGMNGELSVELAGWRRCGEVYDVTTGISGPAQARPVVGDLHVERLLGLGRLVGRQTGRRGLLGRTLVGLRGRRLGGGIAGETVGGSVVHRAGLEVGGRLGLLHAPSGLEASATALAVSASTMGPLGSPPSLEGGVPFTTAWPDWEVGAGGAGASAFWRLWRPCWVFAGAVAERGKGGLLAQAGDGGDVGGVPLTNESWSTRRLMRSSLRPVEARPRDLRSALSSAIFLVS